MGVRLGKLLRSSRRFSPYVLGEWRWMLGAVSCSVGAVAMTLLRPWPLKFVFDDILIDGGGGESAGLGGLLADPSSGEVLAILCLSLLLISLLWGLFNFGQAYLTARAGQAVVHRLRFEAHSHLQRLSLSFHQRQRRGDLLMRLTGDVNVLRDMLVNALVLGVSSVTLLVAMLAVLWWMDALLAMVVVALLPLLAVVTLRFSLRIRSAAQRQRRKEGRIAATIGETLRGLPLIQAFAKQRQRDKRFQDSNRRSLRAGLRTTRLEASMSRIIELILAAGTAAVFWYGVRRVQSGALSPGDLLVFVSYVGSCFKPMRRLARVGSRMAKAVVCAERIRELLREKPEVRDEEGSRPIHRRVKGRLELRKVTFAYRGERALHRLSLEIEPGSFVGLVGPSGAGKSTALSLLLRLYDPDRGHIRLDGRDLRSYTVESLRDQMSVVLQEPFLFGDSIRENILFAKPNASDLELRRAVRRAGVHEFSRRFEDGLDTTIAEAGSSLSAGQRQRIALARAFLRRSPILLLDEPTTGLDAAAEAHLMSALERLMNDCTTVMVAHKLATVAGADQIVVLRRGHIVEQGNHGELMRLDGWYSRTWYSQAGDYPKRTHQLKAVVGR